MRRLVRGCSHESATITALSRSSSEAENWQNSRPRSTFALMTIAANRLVVVAMFLSIGPALADTTVSQHGSGRRRAVTPGYGGWWTPLPRTTWQIQYVGTLDTSVDAAIYDVDGLDIADEDIAALRRAGRRVICYINAGAWEEWRDDAAEFPSSVIGRDYEGWPGEKWLDIRQIAVLAPLLRRRLDICRAKGCDAIDPDNLDGYTHATGFPLTADDQLAFNRFLAREAHARNMSVGLKNDFAQAALLAAEFDFAVAESCFLFDECNLLQPFVERGKAIFAIEYTDTAIQFHDVCERARGLKIEPILKNRSLDAWRMACP